jgi:hypothetical protein
MSDGSAPTIAEATQSAKIENGGTGGAVAPGTGAPGGNSGSPVVDAPSGSAPAGNSGTPGTPAGTGNPPAGSPGLTPPAEPVVTDWRKDLAGDNAELLEQLSRYTDKAAFVNAYKELRTKLSQRPGVPQKPDANATPEQIAEYRKAMDIPDNVDTYIAELKLSDGRKIGEADKVIVQEFAKRAQDIGVPKGQFNALVDWYFGQQEAVQTQQYQQDEVFYRDSLTQLKQEWGPDFNPNINAIDLLFQGGNTDFKSRLLGARLADGRKLGDDPQALAFLSGLARELNPMAAIMPLGGSTMDSVDGRINEINKIMQTDHNRYVGDTALQKEYEKLITMKFNAERRGRAA